MPLRCACMFAVHQMQGAGPIVRAVQAISASQLHSPASLQDKWGRIRRRLSNIEAEGRRKRKEQSALLKAAADSGHANALSAPQQPESTPTSLLSSYSSLAEGSSSCHLWCCASDRPSASSTGPTRHTCGSRRTSGPQHPPAPHHELGAVAHSLPLSLSSSQLPPLSASQSHSHGAPRPHARFHEQHQGPHCPTTHGHPSPPPHQQQGPLSLPLLSADLATTPLQTGGVPYPHASFPHGQPHNRVTWSTQEPRVLLLHPPTCLPASGMWLCGEWVHMYVVLRGVGGHVCGFVGSGCTCPWEFPQKIMCPGAILRSLCRPWVSLFSLALVSQMKVSATPLLLRTVRPGHMHGTGHLHCTAGEWCSHPRRRRKKRWRRQRHGSRGGHMHALCAARAATWRCLTFAKSS